MIEALSPADTGSAPTKLLVSLKEDSRPAQLTLELRKVFHWSVGEGGKGADRNHFAQTTAKV